MALVKTSKIPAATSPDRRTKARTAAASIPSPKRRARKSTGDQVADRIGAATDELASGLTEAAAAAEELRRSMEQIAAGAEEAAGASQEQLAAIKKITASLGVARSESDNVRRRTESAQLNLADVTARIAASVRAIETTVERQAASSVAIQELERRALDVTEITGTVSHISDQTNLLALNAAIEAARAGDQGRGFAVVAEEVRALAEASDKSARDVGTLADEIKDSVRSAASVITSAASAALQQGKAGAGVNDALVMIRDVMTEILGASQDTLTAAIETERAITEAQKGAEQIAGAAEEQAAAAGEAQTGVRQQAESLAQGQTAAQSLADLSRKLRGSASDQAAAAGIASTAEELSATIQEMSSAASQIASAVEQISRGSQQQAAAAVQTSAALTEIERGANYAQQKARLATERGEEISRKLETCQRTIDALIASVGESLGKTRGSLTDIVLLDTTGRKIEKIVDQITLVTVQTSMLAVSGAIEAARAGEAGRGFAVVSNDIRALAREASESVERIKDSVRAILDQIILLRRDVEQIIVIGEAELLNNQTVLLTLGGVVAEVAGLADANLKIGHGADEILAATGECAAAARQIAVAAEQATAAARQASVASAQQAQGADDLAAAIEDIALLADELQKQND